MLSLLLTLRPSLVVPLHGSVDQPDAKVCCSSAVLGYVSMFVVLFPFWLHTYMHMHMCVCSLLRRAVQGCTTGLYKLRVHPNQHSARRLAHLKKLTEQQNIN